MTLPVMPVYHEYSILMLHSRIPYTLSAMQLTTNENSQPFWVMARLIIGSVCLQMTLCRSHYFSVVFLNLKLSLSDMFV